jgi:hypothetical protein
MFLGALVATCYVLENSDCDGKTKKEFKYDFIFHFWWEGEVVVSDGKIERKKIEMKFSLFSLPLFFPFFYWFWVAPFWLGIDVAIISWRLLITLVPWPIQH